MAKDSGVHSIIEFEFSTCQIYRCCLQEAPKQYTVSYPQCLPIMIEGDYRDMTEREVIKRCLMKIRRLADFYLCVL